MTDFGQFQEPFAEVPLEPTEDARAEVDERPTDVWWTDDEPEEAR